MQTLRTIRSRISGSRLIWCHRSRRTMIPNYLNYILTSSQVSTATKIYVIRTATSWRHALASSINSASWLKRTTTSLCRWSACIANQRPARPHSQRSSSGRRLRWRPTARGWTVTYRSTSAYSRVSWRSNARWWVAKWGIRLLLCLLSWTKGIGRFTTCRIVMSIGRRGIMSLEGRLGYRIS